jgi:small subunit ribosomal protein S8
MVLNDVLANVYSNILNHEKLGKRICVVKPSSKLIRANLQILQDQRYIGDFKEIEDGKGNMLQINLISAINKCGVIKPRFSVTLDTYDKYEKRFLPSRNIGILLVSTSKGLMTHIQAKEKGFGGKLIAYCY